MGEEIFKEKFEDNNFSLESSDEFYAEVKKRWEYYNKITQSQKSIGDV